MPEDVIEPEPELDWASLSEIADSVELSNAASIKSALPVLFVLEHYNIEITEAGGYKAYCPFHDDKNTPSFTVFGEGLMRWGCWACSINGDVLDLLQRFETDMSFVEICDLARDLVKEKEESGWSGPELINSARVFDAEAALQRINSAQDLRNPEVVEKFISIKRETHPEGYRFDAEFLMEEFYIGTEWDDFLIIPYLDADGAPLTYKRRTAHSKTFAAPGSSFAGVFYNGWRTDMEGAPFLICEGETDTWNAQFELGDTYRVLGVPVGVMTPLRNFELFQNQLVFLAFDGDTAGRTAAAKWADELQKHGSHVRIVPIPRGKDVSQVASSLRHLCKIARPMIPAPAGLRETEGGYVRTGEKSVTPVSNWTFDPERELLGTDGAYAFEGKLRPGGEDAIITSYDLGSQGRIRAWAAAHGRAWYGNDRDPQILLGMLQAQGVFLDTGRMASVAGLTEGHFVWPGGAIGPDYWKYVPPTSDTHLADNMTIEPGPWDPQQIHTLRKLQCKSFTDPILSWMAVAPLRTLYKAFPILAITGGFGSGKSRTVESLLWGFCGTRINQTLSGSTPHSIMSGVSATNAFPTWWDEYRNRAGRSETREVFEQVLRDAYLSQKSQKGGMRLNWAEVSAIATTSPIVVSGEDVFTEGSHVERMIMLQISRSGQNSEVFDEVQGWRRTGIPYAYLSWLQKKISLGEFANLYPAPWGPEGLATRQRVNLGIIRFGWQLLREFMEDAGSWLPEEPNFDGVVSELLEANKHTPIEEAIGWLLGEHKREIVWEVNGQVYVRCENFVNEMQKFDLFVLPGGVRAIAQYLVENFDAVAKIIKKDGLEQKVYVFDKDRMSTHE